MQLSSGTSMKVNYGPPLRLCSEEIVVKNSQSESIATRDLRPQSTARAEEESLMAPNLSLAPNIMLIPCFDR